jgi:hypothetical protein
MVSQDAHEDAGSWLRCGQLVEMRAVGCEAGSWLRCGQLVTVLEHLPVTLLICIT